MDLKNILGYHKYLLKDTFYQFLRINISRLRGTGIREGVKIARGITLYDDNQIGSYTRLDKGVVLSKGVKIGNYSALYNIEIGENSIIESWVGCGGDGNGRIKIGKESYIGISNILDCSDNITIGDYVHIAGPSTGLWTHSSVPMCLNSIPFKQANKVHRPTAPIVIENNVFIGGNCTIYPGVIIGHNSVVAPNTAVTKNVEPCTMVGGVPARKIKDLILLNNPFSEEI